MTEPTIDILLATRNGARYLPVLLQSLLDQTDRDFRILARDDGSSDGTGQILERFAGEHPGMIERIRDHEHGGSARANFSLLMQASRAPYAMLCDQDDQWMPQKVALTRSAMSLLERRHGRHRPLLVHTDLVVVDEALNELTPSMWRSQRLDPRCARRLNRLLAQNVVTGCTTMVNRPLLSKALPVAADAIMHDWWLALVASAFGAIGEVAQPTIRYRQHGANDTGAKQWRLGYIFRKAVSNRDELMRSFSKTCTQARAFGERFGHELDDLRRQQVERYGNLEREGWISRRCTIVRHGFYKIGLIRNLGMLARL